MERVTAMDDAETHDLVTVLMRLEDLKGMAHDIGRHFLDDLAAAAADAERTGLLRKILASLRSWRSAG